MDGGQIVEVCDLLVILNSLNIEAFHRPFFINSGKFAPIKSWVRKLHISLLFLKKLNLISQTLLLNHDGYSIE